MHWSWVQSGPQEQPDRIEQISVEDDEYREPEEQLHSAPRPSKMVFTVLKKINASRPGDMFLT